MPKCRTLTIFMVFVPTVLYFVRTDLPKCGTFTISMVFVLTVFFPGIPYKMCHQVTSQHRPPSLSHFAYNSQIGPCHAVYWSLDFFICSDVVSLDLTRSTLYAEIARNLSEKAVSLPFDPEPRCAFIIQYFNEIATNHEQAAWYRQTSQTPTNTSRAKCLSQNDLSQNEYVSCTTYLM